MTIQSDTQTPLAVVILAAGKGTRMASAQPKVLHRIGASPMLHHAMASAMSLAPARMVVVVGHGGEAVAASARELVPDARIAVQEQQLGTGHAVLAAREALTGFAGDLLVLFGDTPFLAPDTLERVRAARAQADLVVLGFEAADPGRYGRLMTDADGQLEAIVEAKDASPEILAIRQCNSGIMLGNAGEMLALLERLEPENAQREYYLTDLPAMAHGEGKRAAIVLCDEAETLGINDREQLAAAEAIFQTGARRAAMLAGATLTAPETVWLARDTRIGCDVVIGPHVVFGLGVEIADGVEIRAFCHLEQARVASGAVIGPYARLRPGADIGPNAHIGNFVEIKNAVIETGAKANHLTYVGDARIGAGANLGAGTITCNYDGFEKHHTEIGARAFVGVNTALIAPVSVGDDAYIGTGTVVTMDVPPEALAIGRARQINKPGLGARLREKLRALKAQRSKS